MRVLMLGLAGLISVLAADVQPSHAAPKAGPRPWCIVDGVGDTRDCTYHSFEQCYASAKGAGGICIPNPAIEWARRQGQGQRRN